MPEPLRTLMTATLLEVFGERDPDRRTAAIRRTFSEDVVLVDAEETVTGHEALHAKVQRLLDQAPGYVFTPAGPLHEVAELGHQAWNFGPPDGSPAVSGIDIGVAQDGRLARLYTILLPAPDGRNP
ncbi:nuclear transport factor 2 family protein [Kineococcus sp. SYSU DK003]|uniref:nuclear transport factor 2 family protein n=1 Tax=Kineococcus sp. SYSU DK003 TaxID=3383124 RepID=UPI003D7E7719